MNIGMIVAMPEEMGSFLAECGTPIGVRKVPGYEINEYKIGDNNVYLAGSGAGEIAAASTAQMLISLYNVDMIVNFGVVGGLTPEMGLCSTVVIEKLVHYDYDASAFYSVAPAQYPGEEGIYIYPDKELLTQAIKAVPQLRPVTCASADKFVEGAEAKSRLHEKYGADICEMEAAGILLTCKRCGVPALFIKAVSDGVAGGAEEFANMIKVASEVCVKALMSFLDARH